MTVEEITFRLLKAERDYVNAKAELREAREAYRNAGRPDVPNGPNDATPAPPSTKVTLGVTK